MTKASLLLLPLLNACAIDDREVTVGAACLKPRLEYGTATSIRTGAAHLTDFSAAYARGCPAAVCPPGFEDGTAVSLGEGVEIGGLVFPYGSPARMPAFKLDVASPMSGNAALSVTMDSPSPPAAEGLALRFLECVDASSYSGLSFETDTPDSDLGTCPLRFSAQFLAEDVGIFATPHPLDESPPDVSDNVDVGPTTWTFSDHRGARGSTALIGMQWEFSVSSEPLGGCPAMFTIDDIKLVSTH